jgi:hypothetical protein
VPNASAALALACWPVSRSSANRGQDAARLCGAVAAKPRVPRGGSKRRRNVPDRMRSRLRDDRAADGPPAVERRPRDHLSDVERKSFALRADPAATPTQAVITPTAQYGCSAKWQSLPASGGRGNASGGSLNLGRREVLARGRANGAVRAWAPALEETSRSRQTAFQPEGPASLRSHVAAVGLREGAGLRKLGELCRHRVALAPERCRHVPRGRAGVRAHILDDLPP